MIKKDVKRNTYYFVVSNRNGYPKQIKRSGFKTKREAVIAKNNMLYEINKGLYVHNSKMGMDELLQKWMKKKKREVQETTLSTYEVLVKKHISPYFKGKSIQSIKPITIEGFYDHLYDESNLSGTSVQKVHQLLKGCFDYAKKMELIAKSPLESIDRPKRDSSEVEVWDKEEVRLFLEKTQDDPFHVAYLLGAIEGMRMGEVLGLRWKDIDIESKTLCIRQTLTFDGKKLKPGAKNKSSQRTIGLTNETVDRLKNHKAQQDTIKEEFGSAYQDMDLVVCTSLGTPVNPSNLRRSFNRNIKTLGMKKIRFHGLRHSHATICLSLNVHPKIVSERLGHSDIRVTLNTYSHLLPSIQNKAVDQISQAIFG